MENQLVEIIAKHYLSTPEFKGYVIQGWTPDRIRSTLTPLILEGRISARFGDFEVNPSIRRLADPPADRELANLERSNLHLVVLYPTKKELLKYVNPLEFSGRPFALKLAQGDAWLDYCCFDLSVLEFYRNDPRYYYKVSDVFGAIYVQDDGNGMPESDRIFLKSFGFAYDKAMNRAVLAFLSDLRHLTPEHQQIWDAKLLPGEWMMHPDYFASSIQGRFSTHIPILNAFSAELRHINEICKLIGKPPLFHRTFEQEERPKGFTFLIRPTMREFHDFVLLLDKAISENLNKEFFQRDLPLEEEVPRADGKVEVRQIGTLRLLEKWIELQWVSDDPRPLAEMSATFREIRKLRQIPAHQITEDTFDQAYFNQQRDLIIRAYKSVRRLRLMFLQHPDAKGYVVESALLEGRIRDF